MPILPNIYPKSPDPYLERLKGEKSQAALARLAHLNPIIDQINLNTLAIANLGPSLWTVNDGSPLDGILHPTTLDIYLAHQITSVGNYISTFAMVGNDLQFTSEDGPSGFTAGVRVASGKRLSLKGIDSNDGATQAIDFQVNNSTTHSVYSKGAVTNHNYGTLPEYVNDAAADADADLESNSLYKITGDRAIYQKP